MAERKEWEEHTQHERFAEYALGKQERALMRKAYFPCMDKMYPYPLIQERAKNRQIVVYWDIPESDKKTVLNDLWPYFSAIDYDAEFVDLHTGKKFKIMDFRVARYGQLNYLVSPYYSEAGGTVLDWFDAKEADRQGRENPVLFSGRVLKSAVDPVSDKTAKETKDAAKDELVKIALDSVGEHTEEAKELASRLADFFLGETKPKE